ncbi:nucleotidyltransferase family protein [Phreatobacter cathodiphilus]|uniref:DNA processing protein DprA n=1 Tax=Phreatobacter cathodiphilus TaxID=1868589 RepID=A0A2S0N9C2_9HYPH|nr:nucleotidyltransferase domain-containing protein [Phreatobacter cathodiphilus]AVO44760.1 DNA processing protein DprA [Phreatobacter cathodiphilus]
MTREEVIARLKSAESDLRALGIGELYLFGSYARGEATEDSDVDVMVAFAPDSGNRFRTFMTSIDVIQDAVGRPVDVGTAEGFHRLVRAEIDRDSIRVF